MTTVRIPGTEMGNTIRTSEPSREQPSTSAGPSEEAEPRAAVDERGVFELLRDRLEEPHQQPDRERDRERRIDDDERPELVAEMQVLRDDARQRQEQQRRRHEVREEDRDAERTPGPSPQACERITGGQRHEERDRDDEQSDERRVFDPAHVVGVVEEEAVARERGVEPPRLRRVVDLRLRLQRRHEHPEEREREHDRERNRNAVAEEVAPKCHVTSALRAKKSIPIATIASTGSRKSDIAAPSPMLPELMPVVNDHVVPICVELNGPPFVRMYGTTMSVAVKTIPNSTATSAIGSCSGSDTCQNFRRPVAPSIAAASSTSCGIDEMPARKMTTANGIVRHACTVTIDDIAAFGVPSQFGTCDALTRCSLMRNQLKMLACG